VYQLPTSRTSAVNSRKTGIMTAAMTMIEPRSPRSAGARPPLGIPLAGTPVETRALIAPLTAFPLGTMELVPQLRLSRRYRQAVADP
jgi:hypothetical protein